MKDTAGNAAEISNLGCGNRPAQVHEQVEVLGCSLQSLMDSVKELSQRLNPVIREQEPQCESAEKELKRPLVPLASRISDAHGMVANTNGIVLDLLSRLEI